jgi:hypothetical protein
LYKCSNTTEYKGNGFICVITLKSTVSRAGNSFCEFVSVFFSIGNVKVLYSLRTRLFKSNADFMFQKTFKRKVQSPEQTILMRVCVCICKLPRKSKIQFVVESYNYICFVLKKLNIIKSCYCVCNIKNQTS